MPVAPSRDLGGKVALIIGGSRNQGAADPRAMATYAPQRLNTSIAAYQAFPDKIRGRDDVSFALVVGLLGAETHRGADVMAALAGHGARA